MSLRQIKKILTIVIIFLTFREIHAQDFSIKADRLVFKGCSRSMDIVVESFNIVSSLVLVDPVILTSLLNRSVPFVASNACEEMALIFDVLLNVSTFPVG